MDLEAIDYFIKVCDARSLSNAAKLHRLPKSTLSHKIRQLEDRLGVALFVREGRDMFLTDAGTEFLDHAYRIQASCDGAEAAIAAMRQEIAGTLTIGSTGEFGTSFTSELLFAFRQRFPQVKIDVIFLSSGYLFAPERQQAFDGIFYWGEPSNVDYIARRLTSASFGLYASPIYIEKHGRPETPAELHDHRGIAFRIPTGLQSWHLKNGEETHDVLPPATCIANDYWMIKYFAVAGEGLAYLPDFFTEIECATGHLVPVMPQWRSPEVSVNLLYPRRRYVSRKFAAFQSFCIDFYKQRADHYVPRYCVEVVSSLTAPPRQPL
ncbi:MAG TPA: LysR substrate-binding domain-containing protein [Nordella sp.]|nr:LysR substrate-binding domain-containing protein [Nordella sp.]